MNRKLYASTIAACVALTIAGCSKKTDEPTTSTADGRTSTSPSGREAAKQKMALVRFVNATPGQAMDLWFGDTKAFSDTAYKTVTPYRELPGERHDFQLRFAGRANTGDPNAKNSEGLTDGAHYTVVALLDNDGKPKLNVVNDSLSEPASGRAKVRVINAARQEVDVFSPVTRKGDNQTADRAANPARVGRNDRTAGEDKWFGGVNADHATEYKDVDPVNSTLMVRPAASKDHGGPGVSVPVDFAAGKMYTLIVTGGDKGHALDVVKVVDELSGAATASAAR